MESYDFLVIGGGSGGVRAARIASGYGARVALIEKGRLGGTCVIRGCVPKKLFVYASHFGEMFEDARGFGWSSSPNFSWQTLLENKNREIKRLESVYAGLLQKARVDVYYSHARFQDPYTVFLEETQETLKAKVILIATGAIPDRRAAPSALGENLLVSDDVFELSTLPKEIAIVGGGYIALEFAGILNGLGVKTTLLYRGEQILRGFDGELRAHFAEEIKHRGVDVRCGVQIKEARWVGSACHLLLTTGEELHVDRVLWAAGRIPNTASLGLEDIGVACDGRGMVLVKSPYQTLAHSHIYAIGDVVNQTALTPLAIAQGQALADTLFGGKPWQDPGQSYPPTAVFSQPEVATVGLPEEEARRLYGDVTSYKTIFRPMVHTLSGRNTKTFLKLVVEQKTEKILGAHLVGEGSAELIQLLGVMVKAGLTKSALNQTLAVHPTISEEFVFMK